MALSDSCARVPTFAIWPPSSFRRSAAFPRPDDLSGEQFTQPKPQECHIRRCRRHPCRPSPHAASSAVSILMPSCGHFGAPIPSSQRPSFPAAALDDSPREPNVGVSPAIVSSTLKRPQAVSTHILYVGVKVREVVAGFVLAGVSCRGRAVAVERVEVSVQSYSRRLRGVLRDADDSWLELSVGSGDAASERASRQPGRQWCRQAYSDCPASTPGW